MSFLNGYMIKSFGAVWNYRGFIIGTVKREFQIKYRNSLFGSLWAVINPLSMIIVYTLVFSQLMRNKISGFDNQYSYSIFLCSGALIWGMFNEILSRAQSIFIEYANFLKKIAFPRACLPIIIAFTALINFSIIFGLFTIFLLLIKFFPGLSYVAIFPLIVIVLLFSIGLGVLIGISNVFFRDTGQFFNIFIQFWFWFTPIVYPITALPNRMQELINFNPMTPLIIGFQDVLLRHIWPNWITLIYPMALSIVLCLISLAYYRRYASDIVDAL